MTETIDAKQPAKHSTERTNHATGANTDWPHQTRGVAEVFAAIDAGTQRVLLTSPTGGGKTLMMVRMLERAAERNWSGAVYTHRRSLLTQTASYLESHGIDVGIRAAGHKPALLRDVQMCMVASEFNAVFKRKRRDLHAANIVIIDEAHNNTAGQMSAIIDAHRDMEAFIVGVTATPIELASSYDAMVIAGTTSELRACGALVPCRVFAPDEPDLSQLKPVTRDFSEAEQRTVLNPEVIIGRVWDNYQKHNPAGEPALLFAGGVAESLFFAQEFHKRGVSAAHVGNDEIWLNGDWLELNDGTREMLRTGSRDGNPEIICNRFIYREGVDYPWLKFGVLATVFGSMASYIQSTGRLLRSYPDKPHAIIIDHGGNWHRHGSPNDDRDWFLDNTGNMLVKQRHDAMRARTIPEPVTCCRCGCVSYAYGGPCPACGFWIHTRKRVVLQTDGTLRERTGRIYRARPRKQKPDTAVKWRKMFHRAERSKTGMTFTQAEGLFFRENGYYPPRTLPLMPVVDEFDWYRRVRDVSRGDLR